MIDFSTLQGLSVPEGVVTQISVNGKTVWQKAVTPTGIYDDEWPIEWNSLAVANNTTIVFESMTYVKISNLILTTDELATLQWACSVNGNDYASAFTGSQEYNGVRIGYCNFEIGETFASAQIYCVPDEIVGVDLDGITFPESGTYFYLEQGTEYPNEAFSFSLNLPVTATHYLYGREADSVVTYNGVELPDIESVWTDKETYPYAYLDSHQLYLTTVAAEVPADDYANLFFPSEYTWRQYICYPLAYVREQVGNSELTAEEVLNEYGIMVDTWVEGSWASGGAGYKNWNVTWTSADILNEDGTVYLAASDPVKSYTDPDVFIGDVGYVGAVLPKIPEVEGYPYVFMCKRYSSDGSRIEYRLYCFASNAYYTFNEETGSLYFGGGGADPVAYRMYKLSDDIWSLSVESDDHSIRIPPPDGYVAGNIITVLTWANFNIEYDGTVYCEATEPIPVYDKE